MLNTTEQFISPDWGEEALTLYAEYLSGPDAFWEKYGRPAEERQPPAAGRKEMTYARLQEAAIALNGKDPTLKEVVIKAGMAKCYGSNLNAEEKQGLAELAGVDPDKFVNPRLAQKKARQAKHDRVLAMAEEWAKNGQHFFVNRLCRAAGVSESYLNKGANRELREQVDRIFEGREAS